MKTKLILIVLLFSAITAFAQVQVQKSVVLNVNKNNSTYVPQIATNTNTGESVVVWLGTHGENGTVVGQLLDSHGHRKGALSVLAESVWVFDPAIAYNPISNEYLVMWVDRPTTGDRYVFGLRLSSAGKLVEPAFKIFAPSKSPTANWYPRVTFNPRTGGYAAVWEYRPNNSSLDFELVGTSLSKEGKMNGPLLVIKKASGDYRSHTAMGCAPMDIVYQPVSGKLLVAYYAVRTDHNADYYLAALDPLLKSAPASASKKLNKAPILNELSGAPPYEGGSIATHDNTNVVFFQDNDTLKRRNLSPQGIPTGTDLAAFNAPLDGTSFFAPKAVFSTTPAGTRGFLVALQQETSDVILWGQPLDSNGAPVGSPVKLYTPPPSGGINGHALSFFLNNTTAPTFPFQWVGAISQPSGQGVSELKLTVTQ